MHEPCIFYYLLHPDTADTDTDGSFVLAPVGRLEPYRSGFTVEKGQRQMVKHSPSPCGWGNKPGQSVGTPLDPTACTIWTTERTDRCMATRTQTYMHTHRDKYYAAIINVIH